MGELTFDELDGQFTPRSIAVTDSGDVVVFASGRVYRFTSSGHLVGWWGQPFQFSARGGIAVDVDGHVFGITGQWSRREPPIVKFDATGRQLASWGERGQGRGQLFDPIALAVDGAGRVYVADWDFLNPRVMIFDANGTFVDQWDVRGGTAPGLRRPNGLAVNPQGLVYLTDHQSPRLHKLGPVAAR